MGNNKWLKLGIFTALFIVLCIAGAIGYFYYLTTQKFVPKHHEVFTKRVAYIDPENAVAKADLKLCNENFIFDYYNPERARYSKGKNGLRKFILSNYENRNYSDSGYFNVRFVINCKGEAGRYIIHENDLDLEPHQFSEDLKNQLLTLTVQLEDWKPNLIQEEQVDSYMYISYRIEHGEITEILP